MSVGEMCVEPMRRQLSRRRLAGADPPPVAAAATVDQSRQRTFLGAVIYPGDQTAPPAARQDTREKSNRIRKSN